MIDELISTPRPFADLARVLLVFIPGAVVLAYGAVVTYAYGKAWRVAHRLVEPGIEWIGLLPKHVALVTASYVGFIVLAMVEVVERLHQPFAWRSPVIFLLLLAGYKAMRDVLAYERTRITSVTIDDPTSRR